jgi:hypothetical protein
MGICTGPTDVGDAPTISASATTVCSNETFTLTATGALNKSAKWVWYQGFCGSSTKVGEGTQVVVTPVGGIQNYFARAEGGCATLGNGACSSSVSVTTAVAQPVQAILSGNTITAFPGGIVSAYQWINCATNANISGATAATYTPTVAGNYKVQVTDTSGCITESSCVTFCNVASTPTVSGNNSVCSGQSITLSIATGTLNGNTSWRWYSGSCGGTLVGTGTSISVSPTATTDYYVRGEGGCTTNGSCSTVKTVTVNALPNNAVTISGNTLTATQSGASYQWINCNNGNSNIAGATAQSFTPLISGNFAVRITNASGCIATSSCTQITLSLEDFEQFGLKLYPNPAVTHFIIEGETAIEKVTIYTMLGQKVIEFHESDNLYDISSIASGTYIIEVSTENGTAKTRLMKR